MEKLSQIETEDINTVGAQSEATPAKNSTLVKVFVLTALSIAVGGGLSYAQKINRNDNLIGFVNETKVSPAKTVEKVSPQQTQTQAEKVPETKEVYAQPLPTKGTTKQELSRIQEEREKLMRAQESLRRQELEMAKRLEVLKKQQLEETRELLTQRAEDLRAQRIKEYEDGINNLQLQIERTRQDIARREKQISTRIEEATLLYENQISEIEETNRQIKENEEKLRLLREKQSQRLAALQTSHKTELDELNKQKKELERETKDKTSKEMLELERQSRILSAKMNNMSKVEVNTLIRENLNTLGSGLDIEGLDFTPSAPSRIESYEQESDSLQINQIEEKQNSHNVTEWVSTQIKRHKGEYRSYGEWLEVKLNNKI